MKLRAHLLFLTIGAIVPMVIFAVVASAVLAWRERATFRRGAMERSLAVVTAVDAEVKSSIGTLEALAASRHLDTGDLRSFHAEAARVRASQRDWLTIILALPSSEQVVNVLLPFGTPLPPTLERASFDELLRRSVPAVGHLARGPVTEHGTTTLVWAFPVRVPVVREGTTKYVLSAVVKPDRMRALLTAQQLPRDWVGVLLDANARIVARTVAPERSIGELASDSLRTAIAQSPEGWFRGTTREGADVYTPYHRSAFSGWTIAVGIPAAIVEAGARRTFAAMAVGVLGAGVLAFVLAHLLGRRISAPIAILASAATTMGRGERPKISRVSQVAEVRELACALDDAAAAVREANAQLEERVRVRTAELSLSEARYRQLIDDSVQGIAIYRADRVALANAAALRILGYASAGELVDLHAPDDFIAPEYRDEVRQRLEARLRGDPVPSVVQVEALRKDGTRVWVESVASILEWEGLRSTLIVFMNINERRRRELAEQHAAALERVAHLANATAHEINNPLTVIAGHFRMLQWKLSNDPDIASRLERCQEAVTRIADMIANMQKISRLEMLDLIGGAAALDLRRSAQRDPE